MLSVQVLGEPRLLLDGQPAQILRRKARAVVYYLAAHTGPLVREKLLGLLWPDLDRPAAQHSLRAAVYDLHKAIGDSLIVDKESLGLASWVEVDVRLFEARLSPPTGNVELLAAATELYRGDFLDGFCLQDSAEFDEWVAAQRRWYRRLIISGYAVLAELHENRGDLIDALAALDRALMLDPFQEDIERACMRLHYLSGDRAAAIRRYENLRKLLREEMGVPPMAETRTLYDAIITDSINLLSDTARTTARAQGYAQRQTNLPLHASASYATSEASASLPFVGREAELRTIRTHFTDNDCKLVLVEGEPGIGKTRLVEEFVRESRLLAITGVAHELEQILPYQPMVEALRGLVTRRDWPSLDATLRANLAPAWRAEIDRLLPEMAARSSPAQLTEPLAERRLWEAINQLLRALARQQPILVFLDGLQWADASTLGMLGYLVRLSDRQPITYLGATRPCGRRSALATLVQALARENRLEHVLLSRLKPEDVALVARQLSSSEPQVLAEWLTRTSEGSPYILAELVRHARENGVLLDNGTVDVNALLAAPAVSRSIQSLIKARLDRLSETSRRVLDVAVVVGREFDFEVVARVAALSESAALDGLDELHSAGLIRPSNGLRYEFDHSLTVEVAYREMGSTRRQLLHRRVAEAMESIHQARLESVVGRLALHFTQANAAERAAHYALRAGHQAYRLAAWREAISLYQQALAVSDNAERVSVLLSLGNVYFQSGQAARGVEADREAAALARSLGDIAHSEFLLGVALAHEKAELAEFLWGARPLFDGPDLSEAADHLEAAEALYRQRTSTPSEVLARITILLGVIAARQGDLSRAITLYSSALAIAQASEDQDITLPQAVVAHMNLAYYLCILADHDALRHALTGLRLSRENGLLGFQPYLLSIVGEIKLASDDPESAENHFTEGLILAERLSIPYPIAGLAANLGRVALRRGDVSAAVEQLSSALTRAEALGTRHLAAQIRLWLIPLLGEEQARSHIIELRDLAAKQGRPQLLTEIVRLEAKVLPRSSVDVPVDAPVTQR